MMTRTHSLIAGLFLLVAACSPESTTPVDERGTPPHLTGPFVVAGTITGPGGASICSLVSGQVRVRLLAPSPSSAVGTQFICPASNSYALTVNGGTYYLQVTLPLNASIGDLVLRSLDQVPLDVSAPMTRDFQVENGLPFGGGVTLDGAPLPGLSINILHSQVRGFLSTTLNSSATGGWIESGTGRDPVRLQDGASYQVSGSCEMLGANGATPPPTGAVVFPTHFDSYSCSLVTNTASDRTHFSGRLAVTADAGEFGAQAPLQAARRGRGWGVQFPIGPAGPQRLPTTATQLTTGGLIFGFSPNKVLEVVDLSPYNQCGPSCGDFDISGSPVISSASPGKVLTWRYSDATSPESEGLQVTQRSYDGTGDFVLFQFVIRNTSTRTKTFWAGDWMDWDLDHDPSDDGVETDLGGRLMYSYSGMTFQSNVPSGNHLGSMMLGQPISGNYAWGTRSFYCQIPDPTPGQQVAALSGALSAPSQTTPTCDKRYIHGAGPITLLPGHQTDLWIPIVAGTDKAEMITAATAAESWWQQNGQRATIGIDILPGSATNAINSKKSGLVPVAILGGPSFDVVRIDFTTLVLGPSGAPPVHNLSDPKVFAGHLQDVNRDGYTDLVTHYQQQDAGLSPGATQACVNGVTITGTVFDGCDVVQVK